MSFETGVAASGGPNLPVHGSGLVERAVATSPGGPREVLVEPDRADHVPGCNLAVPRDVLEEVGGFNPAYTAAGDDIDVCWRIKDRGYEIGFAPCAQIFHHRRGTVRGYLRQQRDDGRAERLMAGEHPRRFNRLGRARALGFAHGDSRLLRRWLRPVVYTGSAGDAPFQPIVERRSELVAAWVGAMLPLLAATGLSAGLLALAWPALTVIPALIVLVTLGYGAGIALVTTATLWGWEPCWRVTVRPRSMAVLTVVVMVLAAAVLGSVLLTAAAVVTTAATAIEWARVRRVVLATISASTQGAARERGTP